MNDKTNIARDKRDLSTPDIPFHSLQLYLLMKLTILLSVDQSHLFFRCYDDILANESVRNTICHSYSKQIEIYKLTRLSINMLNLIFSQSIFDYHSYTRHVLKQIYSSDL
jgi:hypothetical protein